MAKRHPPATIAALTVSIQEQRLRVEARVLRHDGMTESAVVPDRELSTLLPRSILAPQPSAAGAELADTVAGILRRTVLGRRVRTWEYGASRYLSFLSWRAVRLAAPDRRIEVQNADLMTS